jgi:fluoride exporter
MAPTIERSFTVRTIVAIGIAGGLGALARYGLDGLISRRLASPFPWGTFAVNVSGAFVLGFLMTLMTEQLTAAPWLRSALTIGLLGAYTTFSTLSYETYRLLEDGAVGLAAANVLGSAGAGLAAVYLGVVLGRAL